MAKPKKRKAKYLSEPINLNDYRKCRKIVKLQARNTHQQNYIDLLQDPSKLIVFASGPAGTGKTLLAVLAAIKEFKEGTVDKIILTRPAVGVDDEKHGFLPGDLNSKMEPWVKPLFDVFYEYYSVKDVARMLEEGDIEISPLAFMRGRNFHNCFIICDECQNTTENQMKMILTRVGENSKLILTGDLEQTDVIRQNGLLEFLDILSRKEASMISHVAFNTSDIQRSEVVKEVLKLYKL